MKDFLEREIQIGDYFTIAGRRGSSLWLKVGKVLGFAPANPYSYNKEGRIIARTISGWGTPSLGRKAYLERLNRMTIVRKEDVPKKYLDLLETE